MSPTSQELQHERNRFLAAVHEITQGDLNGWTDLRQIGDVLGRGPNELESIARLMRDRRLIRFESGGSGFIGPISITALGLDKVENEALSSGHDSASRELVVMLFVDIVGSTALAACLGDRKWTDLLNSHRSMVREKVSRHGREIDTAGDGFFAVFTVPSQATACALNIRNSSPGLGVSVRCGLHAGEVVRQGAEVSGLAVHAASRIAGLAGEGEILASSTVRELLIGSPVVFTDRGKHTLRDVEPPNWQLFAVSVAGN
jgi:class 3 adenylate cyclase